MSSNADEDAYMPDRLSPSESSENAFDDENRPNRFQGPDSTWRGYTKDERSLAASLDQSRANDLSVHLYNAHALKARLYETKGHDGLDAWSTKRHWMKRDEVGEAALHPDPQWTAWPLPAQDVPRKEEVFGRSLEDLIAEEDTIRKEESWVPGGDLREEVQALMLQKAKERFTRRTWASDQDVGERGRIRAPGRASRSRSRSLKSAGVTSREEDVDGPIPDTLNDEKTPRFLADDEQAHRVLSPSVNEVLSLFDNLLVGLHRSRIGLARDEIDAARAEELITDGEVNTEIKTQQRQTGHHRQNEGLKPRDWSEVLGIASLTGWDPAVVDRAAKRCASLFGEGMSFRTMPETADSRPQDHVVDYIPDYLSTSDSLISSEDEHNDEDSANTLDQHCPVASCKRSILPFPQAWRLRAHLKRTHNYTDGDLQALHPTLFKSEASSRASSHARTWEPPDPLICPHDDCRNPDKIWTAPIRLVEHLRRAHGYNPRNKSPPAVGNEGDDDQESASEASEMVGGVHNDGFLEPVALHSAAPSARATPVQTPSRGRSLSGDIQDERVVKRVKAEIDDT